MGVIGQLPQAPDELPGRETSTGEPPWRKGPSAGDLPALLGPGTHSISVSVPLPDVPAGPSDGPGGENPAE